MQIESSLVSCEGNTVRASLHDHGPSEAGILLISMGPLPTETYVNQLEMVPRRAARYATNKLHRRQDTTSVTDIVHQLKWQPLWQQRTHSRITMMYQITEDTVGDPASYHPLEDTGRTMTVPATSAYGGHLQILICIQNQN